MRILRYGILTLLVGLGLCSASKTGGGGGGLGGLCGSANGTITNAQPQLTMPCAAGATASAVTGGGGSPWTWTCTSGAIISRCEAYPPGYACNPVAAGATANADFTVNFDDVHQTIDGFGGSDFFSGDISDTVLDELYCVNATDPGCSSPGIGLTLLRQGLNYSSVSNAVGVVARGGKVWVSPWTINPDPSTYQASAQDIMNWISQDNAAGVPVYGVTTQNEPDCGCNGGYYWPTGQDLIPWIDFIAPLLHSLSPPVKMMSPESACWQGYAEYIAAIEADPTANTLTDTFGFHQYCNPDIPPGRADGTRPVWEDEICDGSSWDPSIEEAVLISPWIYDAIVTFGANAWHYFWLIEGSRADYGNCQIIATDAVSKRYFAIGNWSRYVRPGWVRIGVSGKLPGFYGVGAFKDTVTGTFAIIAINNSGSDIRNVTFSLSGVSVTGSVTPYVTSGTPIGPLGSDGNLSAGSVSSNVPASIPVSSGVFTSTVPYGVTTFVGKVDCQ